MLQKRELIEQYESYLGGSPEAEASKLAKLAQDVMDIQINNKKKGNSKDILRAFNSKILLGVDNAKFKILAEVPSSLQVGYIRPGAEYETVVRLSNAAGLNHSDIRHDLRGAALRIQISATEYHDLLMTNSPASHARDAIQFVAFAKAMAGSPLLRLPRLLLNIGPSESLSMLRSQRRAAGKPISSLAHETYWSGGAILWGDAGPVRYLLRPARNIQKASEDIEQHPEDLRREMANRLREGDVVFDLLVQPFVDEGATPIEDASIEWQENLSPPVPVATLTIPRQDIDDASGRAMEKLVDQTAFSPWHTTEAFRPLGNLNRARKVAYRASSSHRLNYTFRETVPLRNLVVGRFNRALFSALNRFMPWHKLGWKWGILNITALREQLRSKNLIDTEQADAPPQAEPVPASIPEGARTFRMIDGKFNDLSHPNMGAVGSTFGRNMKPVYWPDGFSQPHPITVSRELMKREAFIPARSLNLLAAAWIQFQVHDWVNHPRHPLGDQDHDITIEMPGDELWQSQVGGELKPTMRIAGNKVSHFARDGYPVFRNATTPWWDGSEVYGNSAENAESLRDGAYLRLHDGYLPADLNGLNITGFNESWWLGLSIMHTLFAREHNVLCDELQRAYPDWAPKRVYDTVRLIISALIAKIHTVEWTPAILATKTIEVGLPANWYGAPKDWRSQFFIWLVDEHALRGIPETLPNHHGTPYSLTEEFVSVYRMHPLIPDDYVIYNFETGGHIRSCSFNDIQGRLTDNAMRDLRLHNVVYSFGIANPGAIRLHNYPRALQRFERNGEIIDLSVVDIIRDRRRGVPRYNDFRAALHRPRVKRWEELSDDEDTIRKLRQVYRTLDQVDTMVGLHAEPPPEGFGFSDTAFRIFILMASRRLQSDRFLTVDYRPEIYTRLGLEWIENNGMTSIILRHCPQLASVLPRTASAFSPFRMIEQGEQSPSTS